MVDLVIFDCDGVLIESEVIAARVESEALAQLGYSITPKEMVQRFAGMSTQKIYTLMREDYGYALPDNHADIVRARILEEFHTTLQPVEGVAEILHVLDVPVCVASSSVPDKLRLGLTVTGLVKYFDPHLFSASMVSRGKPAPDLFLFAAQKMGVDLECCLVIEDSVPGIQAAKAAGIKVFGFCGGEHCADGHGDKLRDNGADYVFSDMRELPALIGALN